MFQSDWFGNSLYELIHPDDMEKLREQLSTSETQNASRILDMKSTYSVSRTPFVLFTPSLLLLQMSMSFSLVYFVT